MLVNDTFVRLRLFPGSFRFAFEVTRINGSQSLKAYHRNKRGRWKGDRLANFVKSGKREKWAKQN